MATETTGVDLRPFHMEVVSPMNCGLVSYHKADIGASRGFTAPSIRRR